MLSARSYVSGLACLVCCERLQDSGSDHGVLLLSCPRCHRDWQVETWLTEVVHDGEDRRRGAAADALDDPARGL